ncbi:hypothetical protein [Streptomyces telluris]|uniref:Uncharacterized protein n=1 Tax=Streptomyces telluris TaxID=2720021 RepID=A0A9X2LKZ1_9ACTN|nr:hypothetical protein [Streptomyces telluris]MCQ8773058.1 hypothetical protein [Streptomyces telluris]
MIRQDIDGMVGGHIDEDGSEAPASAEGELVDTEHPQRGHLRQFHGTDHPQQGGPAHRGGQVLGEAFAGLSAESQRDLLK